MRANLRTFFEHHNGKVRIDLLEPDRSRKPRGASAHDHNVEFHALAWCQVVVVQSLALLPRLKETRSAAETTTYTVGTVISGSQLLFGPFAVDHGPIGL